jgi:hypothetical protein
MSHASKETAEKAREEAAQPRVPDQENEEIDGKRLERDWAEITRGNDVY